MTFSFEVSAENRDAYPPFADGCPVCTHFAGAVVPYATTTEGSTLIALYRHRRCGHQWSCRWQARWSNAWAA
ncbi:hypothetical protein ACFYUR_12530 [Micromonospora haikouensis]|uniref:hypothetical protein n=1 Tax=Micromonospora haikouensis TaxID=686309 RepID=UPI00368839A1